MYEESGLNYFRGGLVVGIGLGLLSEVASMIWYHRKKVSSADQMLESIKTFLLKEDTAGSAWISFEKGPIRKFAVRSSAYRGRLSRIEGGGTVYYELLADIHAGTILDISRKKGAIG